MIAVAKDLSLVASCVTPIDKYLLGEASRHPSYLPRSFCAFGEDGSWASPSSFFFRVERALVAIGVGHGALMAPNSEEGEATLDP